MDDVQIIVIAASTGGPNALLKVIPKLPADLDVPILLVQHMPPLMTKSLASSLNQRSQLKVKEGIHQEKILPNVVYIAPGGRHMVVKKRKDLILNTLFEYISINDDPPENSIRPSADVLFRSVARAYDAHVLCIVMTGMGSDGTKGVVELKKRSCYCITQTEETCIVYGMPMMIDKSGLSDEQVPLENIADRIVDIVKN